MTSLTAKRRRTPVRFSYQPVTGWDGRLPILGARTPTQVWCDKCVDVTTLDRDVWGAHMQELPISEAPEACACCSYQFRAE